MKKDTVKYKTRAEVRCPFCGGKPQKIPHVEACQCGVCGARASVSAWDLLIESTELGESSSET